MISLCVPHSFTEQNWNTNICRFHGMMLSNYVMSRCVQNNRLLILWRHDDVRFLDKQHSFTDMIATDERLAPLCETRSSCFVLAMHVDGKFTPVTVDDQ